MSSPNSGTKLSAMRPDHIILKALSSCIRETIEDGGCKTSLDSLFQTLYWTHRKSLPLLHAYIKVEPLLFQFLAASPPTIHHHEGLCLHLLYNFFIRIRKAAIEGGGCVPTFCSPDQTIPFKS